MLHRQPRSWWRAPVALAAALALCGPAVAQEAPPKAAETPPPPKAAGPPPRGARPGDQQKVFVIRHADARRLTQLLSVFPASIRYSDDPEMTALAVSAAPAVLAAIEETIKRLDQPRAATKSIEITGYVLEALAEPKETKALPPELEGAVTQLRRTFKYPAYRLLDTFVARARDGSRFEVKGMAERSVSPLAPTYYSLKAYRASVSSSGERPFVQLQDLEFELNMPTPVGPAKPDAQAPVGWNYRNTGFKGNIDLQDGQRAVVGKSGLADSDNALVLVLSAKIVD